MGVLSWLRPCGIAAVDSVEVLAVASAELHLGEVAPALVAGTCRAAQTGSLAIA